MAVGQGAPRMGFGRTPAVLVVDMVRAFTDPQLPLGLDVADEIACAGRLVATAQEAGVPVFYTTVAYDDPAFADAGIWRLKQRGTASLAAGSPGVALDPRLPRKPTDAVIVKKQVSAFFGTDLVARLVNLGIDTAILAGCVTSGCVRATVVDCCQYGFRPMVVRQAVADRSAAAHAQSLADIDAKYGDVIEEAAALDYLRGVRTARTGEPTR